MPSWDLMVAILNLPHHFSRSIGITRSSSKRVTLACLTKLRRDARYPCGPFPLFRGSWHCRRRGLCYNSGHLPRLLTRLFRSSDKHFASFWILLSRRISLSSYSPESSSKARSRFPRVPLVHRSRPSPTVQSRFWSRGEWSSWADAV